MSGDGNMNEVGHNNPPEVLELAETVISDISMVMADIPVVEDEKAAREMKVQIDRAKLCIRDLDAELANKVRPLLAAEEGFRGQYRPKKGMLNNLLEEMLDRVQIFVKAEQRRREQAAALLVAQAHEARRKAEESERIELEQLDNASKGEVGINVAEVISDADEAYEAYCKAERQAEIAEKDTRVKVGGGFSRAIGMRKAETLHLDDIYAFIIRCGIPDEVTEAVLKHARAYRKVHGKLPEG